MATKVLFGHTPQRGGIAVVEPAGTGIDDECKAPFFLAAGAGSTLIEINFRRGSISDD